MLAWLDERDRDALPAGSTGPADPVDVRVGVRRDIEVDDVRDVLDVESACRHVGRDEDVERAVTEAAHDPVAALLAQAAVQCCCLMAPGAEGFGEIVDLTARPAEDQGRRRVLHVEDPAQRRELVGPPHDVRHLADASGAVADWSHRRGP